MPLDSAPAVSSTSSWHWLDKAKSWLAAVPILIAASFPATAETIAGTATVIDGDTIEIHRQRIRLHGIDAPEGRQICTVGKAAWRCGTDAANALSSHINRNPVSCRVVDIDRYKRSVAVCTVRGGNINDWLVRQGWAVAYRRYSKDYVEAEAEAKAAKRGIWASEFENPADWRRKK